MTGNLVAPRPVRILSSLQLPFFLSNALYASNAPNPVQLTPSVNAVAGALPDADVQPSEPAPSASSAQNRADSTKPILNRTDAGEKTIEELAASIRLDDEPQNRPPSSSLLFNMRSNATSPPARSIGEDIIPATPRSPESAVLDEFLSILKPVIRAPSSPIARSKRLLPRSRHHHHHGHGHGHGLTISSDRHHPYARSAKSTSPSYENTIGNSGVGAHSKRSLLTCGRSSTTSYGRRRSSNANESTHSLGSTSMSSSRSQSISRNGSDNSSDELNAWRPSSPSAIVNDVNMSMDTFNDQEPEPPGPGTTSLLVLSGPSTHIASPDHQQ